MIEQDGFVARAEKTLCLSHHGAKPFFGYGSAKVLGQHPIADEPKKKPARDYQKNI